MSENEKPKLPRRVRKLKPVVVGTKRLVDEETGVVEEFAVIQKNVFTDYNFHKVWLTDIMAILDSFGNKKIKILGYLLSRMRDSDNSLNVTHTLIQEELKISRPTVAATMQELLDGDVIRRDEKIRSLYYFNPAILIKGSSGKRQRLLIEYNQIDNKKTIKTLDDYYDPHELKENQEVRIGDASYSQPMLTT